MNSKNIILTSLFAVGCFMASAQQEVKTEEVFAPHWYGGVQAGFQHTLGELDWSDLNSFNGQVQLGYQFSPVWGARLAVSGGQSKAGTPSNNWDKNEYKWSWNYVAPTLDVTFDLTNALGGFNVDRKLSLGVFAGLGANIAWGNDEAADANAAMIKGGYYAANKYDQTCPLRKLWDGTHTLLVLQWGANLDYNVTRNLSLGLEAQWNVTGDSYNSKKAGNSDWYFNTLAGVKYKFGKPSKTRYITIEDPCLNCTKEKEIVHDTITVYVNVPTPEPESIRRDIFFVLRGTEIADSEMAKIFDLVAYLQKYPKSKISITGYADRGTGNARINRMYAEKRANVVANTLAEKFGIDRSRMIVDSKGDTEQPFAENDRNRVSICIAE